MPWWWWPPALLVIGLLAAEVHMGYPGVRAWLPYVLLLPIAAVVLVRLGRSTVGVITVGGRPGSGTAGAAADEDEVVAGLAHLPVRFVGRTDVVAGARKQRALGPDLDPEAFVLHRPWISSAVRLEVLDRDDPTPYWVVSTRHPDRLVEAIREAARGPGWADPA